MYAGTDPSPILKFPASAAYARVALRPPATDLFSPYRFRFRRSSQPPGPARPARVHVEHVVRRPAAEAVELAHHGADGLQGPFPGAEAVDDVAEVDAEPDVLMGVPAPDCAAEDADVVAVVARHAEEGPAVGDVGILHVSDDAEREERLLRRQRRRPDHAGVRARQHGSSPAAASGRRWLGHKLARSTRPSAAKASAGPVHCSTVRLFG
ncbi:hypothetical protein SETIT_5G308700v2 [Setaria italica]|uniref:Uncharacterized protein n=1 Tax=Setaria italica TaxID=4555 RepID=A0A368RAY1_SETIT|nr:hypothetical protein SETIT_5G308700v2 [Setaria italica]